MTDAHVRENAAIAMPLLLSSAKHSFTHGAARFLVVSIDRLRPLDFFCVNHITFLCSLMVIVLAEALLDLTHTIVPKLVSAFHQEDGIASMTVQLEALRDVGGHAPCLAG